MAINWKRFTLGAVLLACLPLLISGCGDYGSSQQAPSGVVAKPVTGVVSGDDGLSVAGATVTAYAIDANGAQSATPLSVNPVSTTTNDAGVYQLYIPADYNGPFMLEASLPPAKLIDRLAKLLFSTSGRTMRAAVPQRTLDTASLPPIMISFATNAVVEFIQQNAINAGAPAPGFTRTGFSADNIVNATFVMEAFFGAYFTQVPPPSSEEALLTSSRTQQDLVVLTRALAQVASDPTTPLSVGDFVTGIATTGLGDAAAEQIQRAVTAISTALAATNVLPAEYVPSPALETTIANVTSAPLPPPVLSDSTPPSAPGALGAAAASARNVTLGWTASLDGGAGATGVAGYLVYRADALTPFLVVDTVGPAATGYSDVTAAPGTQYSYRVVAFDGAHNLSLPSNVAALATPTLANPADTSPPGTPAGLVCKGVTDQQANLEWLQSSDVKSDGSLVPATGYQVYRDFQVIATVTGTSFIDTGVAAGSQYSYYVKAFDANSNLSPASTPLVVRTVAAQGTTPPAAPSALALESSAYNRATLVWSASATGGVTYAIYRGSQRIASGIADTRYSDTAVVPGSTYSYTVTAVDANGESAASNALSVALPVVTSDTPPSVPANLVLVAPPTSNSVPLTWSASLKSDGDRIVAGYEVLRALGSGSFQVIATVRLPGYVDSSVLPSTTYSYQVRAFSTNGARSAASTPTLTITTGAVVDVTDTTPPSAPANLSASAAANAVALIWSASVKQTGDGIVAGYRVYRDGLQIASVVPQVAGAASVSYIDNSVQAGTSYRYTVRAFDNPGNLSAASNEVVVATPQQPANTSTLSGRITINGIGLPGVIVAITGDGTGSFVTDANGYYSGTVLYGSYSITPSAPGYLFTPASHAVTVTSQLRPPGDFSATLTGSISGGGTTPGGQTGVIMTYPNGTVVGGTAFPPGTIIGGVSYPSGAVIGGVTYPTATVIGGVTYPTGTVIGGVLYPGGVVIGGVSYPAGTVVGGIAFPVGTITGGFTLPSGTVVGGVTYPNGAVIGGVTYPAGTIIGGVTYPTGSVIGSTGYPTGTVIGGVTFPSGIVTGGTLFPGGSLSGILTYPVGSLVGSVGFPMGGLTGTLLFP